MRFRVISVQSGKVHQKVFRANNAQELKEQLEQANIMVVEITPLVKKRISFGFQAELCACFRQFSILLDSHVPLDEILKYCINQHSHIIASLLQDVLFSLENGKTLSEGFRVFGNKIPSLYYALLNIGEKSGKLQEVFAMIAQHMQERLNYQKKIKKLLFYPSVVLSSIVIFFIIGVMVIIPEFRDFFHQNAMALPWITKSLLWLDLMLRDFGVIMLLLMSCFVILMRFLWMKKKKYFDVFFLRLPFIGSLLLYSKNHHFLQALYFLQSCGNDFKESLLLSSEVFDSIPLQQKVLDLIEKLQQGVLFAQALYQSKLFDFIALALLCSGEKSGKLDVMLLNAAKYYQGKAQDLLERILLYLEPLCSLVLALLVLYLALGIFLPIWNLEQMSLAF